MAPKLKGVALAAAGIVIGILFAHFRPADFIHCSLDLDYHGDSKPLMIGKVEGRKVVALSVRNLQAAKDVRLRLDGAEISSTFPPPVVLPFRHWVSFKENTFRGLCYGQKFPLFITLGGGRASYELAFFREPDGTLIKKILLIPGEAHGKHH
ncbi:MAG: hypothetical protein HY892_07820 [Deltaproteobacteria bacterium]|nr:hypothetical protein [Deltaproteobacteria bacterium]